MRTLSYITIVLLSIFLNFQAIAQNRVVSEAIQAYHAGEYQKCFDMSGDALANLDELTNDYIAAAYYYHAKSRIQILRLAMETNNQEKLSHMQNALIESYFDYKEGLKTADDKIKADINQDMLGLYNPILQTGLSALNTSNDKQQAANVREAALKAAYGYLDAAHDISPTYLACDLLGQVLIAQRDSLAAYELFKESINAYKKQAPPEADFLMAYVFFRKALIERYYLGEARKALATLMEGETLITNEYGRSTNLAPVARTAYDNGMLDLIGFELDIYLNEPELLDEALVRFQEVMQIYPEDYGIHVAYANLLEEVEPLLAIDAYETAISIDDSKELAYFNLGAIYNNMGSELYLKGLNTDDEARADSLYEEANASFRNAYINMEHAYNINPNSIPTIRALVQLANTLGLDEKAEEYKQREAALRGF